MTGKKILIGISVLIVLGLLVFFTNHFYQKMNQKTMDPFYTIPENAALIIRFNNFNSAFEELSNQQSVIYKSLSFSSFQNLFNATDSLLNLILKNEELKAFVTENPCFVSTHFSGETSDVLFTFSIQPPFESDDISDGFQSFGKISVHDFKSKKIGKLQLSSGQQLYFTFNFGILSLSGSESLLEKVILREVNTDTSKQLSAADKRLMKISDENSACTIFVNYQYAYRYISQIAENQLVDYFSKLGLLGGKASFELRQDSEYVMLNGFSLPSEKNGNLVAAFKNQKAGNMYATNLLPASTVFYASLFFDDFESISNQLSVNNFAFFNPMQLKDFEQKYGLKAGNLFYHWMKSEITIAMASEVYEQLPNRTYAILNTKDINEASNDLMILRKLIESKRNVKGDSTIYSEFMIHHIQEDKLLSFLFGKPFSSITSIYYTAIDNSIVFANSVEALQFLIDQNISKNTLAKDEYYEEFAKNLSNESNFTLYINPNATQNVIPYFLNQDAANGIQNFKVPIGQFDAIGIQLIGQNEGCFTNLLFHYKTQKAKKIDYKWQAILDDDLLENHFYTYNNPVDNKTIYLAIDTRNNLYKIDQTGIIQWKIPLVEKPMGAIHFVQVIDKNEILFVFNSATKIYALNTLGNKAEGYPLSLPLPAGEDISIVNFEKNGSYNFLVRTTEKSLLCLDKNGRNLASWLKPKVGNSVKHTFKWINNADFSCLTMVDEIGNIQFFNRNGKTIFDGTTRFSINPASTIYEYTVDKKNFLLAVDKGGRIILIDKKGKIIKQDCANMNEPFHFLFNPSKTKNLGVFAFISDTQIKIFNEKMTIVNEFSPQSKINIHSCTLIKYQTDSFRLVANDMMDNTIHIFKSNGTAECKTGFDKAKNFFSQEATLNREMYLISVDGRIINCFLF